MKAKSKKRLTKQQSMRGEQKQKRRLQKTVAGLDSMATNEQKKSTNSSKKKMMRIWLNSENNEKA
jgi:hypothetical protein